MWQFPLDFEIIGPTYDSMSFQNIDITKQVEVPVRHPENPEDHVGSFGAERRHDVHKGVDLYCPVGTPVYAVEDGAIVHIRPFTGVDAGCPWWEDTWAISVAGNTGIVVYGEIVPAAMRIPTKLAGNLWSGGWSAPTIKAGDLIGHVKRVLKKDKGRPTSMLHLTLHAHGVLSNGTWEKGEEQPEGLIDPTLHLLTASKIGGMT